MARLRIAVVGCGTAGAAIGTLLARAGHGLGVHRGALWSALGGALERSGAQLRTGSAISRLDDARLQGADLVVVVVGGAGTALRAQRGLCPRVKRPPWGALRTIVDDPGGAYAGRLEQAYLGTRELIGFLPTGAGADGGVPRVSMFVSATPLP